MRILLIDPPGNNKGFNTGLGYLSAALEGRHQVRVLDLNNILIGRCGDPNPALPVDQRDLRIARSLSDFEPQIVGISVKTFTVSVAKSILQFIKKTRPAMACIVGGPHVTLDGPSFVRETGADFGMQGEGEYGFLELCDILERNGAVGKIAGILHWRDGEVRLEEPNPPIEKLDNLEFPNYRNFSSVVDNGGKIPEYPILTSRGCPYKCSYCSMPEIMGGKWRSRDPVSVVDELGKAREVFGSTSFTVIDDNLTINSGRVEQMCDLLISRRLSLPWNSQNGIRADRVSAALAKKMSLSGCRYVWVGIESADEEVFTAIDKGESLDDIRKGIGHLQKAGIKVGGFFIVGLPGSTRSRDLKMIDFVRAHHIDAFVFNFVPYPKTRATDWIRENGKVLRASTGVLQFGADGIEPVFETHDYSKEDRMKTFNEINIRLGYFDRLVDPSTAQHERWRKVYRIVRPYGRGVLSEFLCFILRYNAVQIKDRILARHKRMQLAET
jgi:anaerobic magnesium-protoporphyrin IX monomethyl ester cyclase